MVQEAQSFPSDGDHNDNPATESDRADAKQEPSISEQAAQIDPLTGKKRRKKKQTPGSVLAQSAHTEEYCKLMAANWTSFSLERYAAYRYGETIKASTFRNYKARRAASNPKWLQEYDVKAKNGDPLVSKRDELRLDVMGIREQLALLQLQRLAVDVKTEMNMGKLWSGTHREIQLASDLLDKIKTDQQDFGILPKVVEETQVTVRDLPGDVAPRHTTLGEALGINTANPAELFAAARKLGNIVPINKEREAG